MQTSVLSGQKWRPSRRQPKRAQSRQYTNAVGTVCLRIPAPVVPKNQEALAEEAFKRATDLRVAEVIDCQTTPDAGTQHPSE